jgi:hypothetical protein
MNSETSSGMLKEVHSHVVSELQQNSRTDTVFVVVAVLFNLVALGINWGVASEGSGANRSAQHDWILVLLIIATLLINGFAGRALTAGSGSRRRLLTGLVAMYQDHGVDKYYDATLLDTYGARYKLFLAVLFILAGISIVVPLLERVLG